jgi:hypothetical protein
VGGQFSHPQYQLIAKAPSPLTNEAKVVLHNRAQWRRLFQEYLIFSSLLLLHRSPSALKIEIGSRGLSLMQIKLAMYKRSMGNFTPGPSLARGVADMDGMPPCKLPVRGVTPHHAFGSGALFALAGLVQKRETAENFSAQTC